MRQHVSKGIRAIPDVLRRPNVVQQAVIPCAMAVHGSGIRRDFKNKGASAGKKIGVFSIKRAVKDIALDHPMKFKGIARVSLQMPCALNLVAELRKRGINGSGTKAARAGVIKINHPIRGQPGHVRHNLGGQIAEEAGDLRRGRLGQQGKDEDRGGLEIVEHEEKRINF